MQGLGSGPVTLAGSEALKAAVLPKVARGEWISAFALSEPEALSAIRLLSFDTPPRILIGGSLYLAGDVLRRNGPPPV